MIRRALTCMLLLSTPALAQSPGTVNLYGPSTTPGAPQVTPSAIAAAVNLAFMGKVDAVNGALSNPAITNGSVVGAAIGSSLVTVGASTNPQSLAALSAQQGYAPDWFKQSADGADDAPSIQRAVNLICSGAAVTNNLNLLARHYTINSPISQTCLVNWRGQGFLEQTAQSQISAAPGTWLDIGAAFVSVSTGPITITGNATGSDISDMAFDEPGMTVPPVAVMSGSNITGWSPSSFTPVAYTQIFTVSGVPNVTFHHLMFDGINAGIAAISSGRTSMYDIRGQVFAYLINEQTAEDVSRIVDIHEFPYWSQADPVVQYQQANTQLIESFRNDTPFWDRIFAFGVKNGIALHGEAAGATTGASVGTVSCDFTKSCIQVYNETTNLAQFQINNIRSYG